ncbi:hypothetical protein V2G26_020297 [Clonostachys chloroleuca]
MIVILSLVLAFHTWGLISTGLRKVLGGGRKWLLDLELKGVAPSGFSSIAMMNDLLCGSNIRENLPRTEQQRYTVGIVERGEFEFISREKC